MIDQKAITESLSALIDYSVKYSDSLNDIEAAIEKRINEGYYNPENCAAAKAAVEFINLINKPFQYISENKTHIENYMLISDVCANHTTPGGEVWCTENGIDWEPITVDGFGDKYNHGIRTMAVGDDGSFNLGCANPYYGAQFWKLTDENMIESVIEDEASVAPDETLIPDSEDTGAATEDEAGQTADVETNEKDGFLGWLSNAFKTIASRFGF